VIRESGEKSKMIGKHAKSTNDLRSTHSVDELLVRNNVHFH